MQFRAVGTLMMMLLAASACQQWQVTPSGPRKRPILVCDESTYDFGRVVQGATVQHTYTIRNSGELNLRIDNVRAGCDCAAVISSGAVAAGDGATITVSFDTGRAFGAQKKSIAVYSNDPAQPVTTLTLGGEVVASMAADPPQLYLGHVSRDQVLANAIRLFGPESSAAGSVSVSGNTVGATLHAGAQAADRRIRLQINQAAPLGPFTDSVTVHGTNQHVLVIPISGTVDGDVIVSPTRLDFGAITLDRVASEQLEVRNRGKRPVQVLAATLSPAIGEVHVESVHPGEEYRIAVALQHLPAARPGSGHIHGTLRLETDHPEQQLITVPFSGHISERR